MFKKLRFPDAMPPRTRTVFSIVALMTAGLTVGLAVFAFLVSRTLTVAVQVWSIVGVGVAVLVAQLVSLGILWRGRSEAIHWLAFLPIFLLPLTASILVSGVELAILAVATIPVLAVNTLQILPARQARTITIIGLLIGILSLFMDWFQPFVRQNIPGLSIFSYVLLSVEVLVFGYIVIRKFPAYSLRTKQLVALLSVSLIVMLVFGILTYFTTESRLTADAGRLLHNGAGTQSRILGDFVSQQMDLLTALKNRKWPAITTANSSYSGSASEIQATITQLDEQWIATGNNNSPLMMSILENDTAAVLNDYKNSFPENEEIFVTDKFGALVAATNRTSDYNQGDEAWWQAAYNDGKGNVYIGQMEYDESLQVYAVIIAVPLFSPESGTVIGVLRTTVSMQAVIEFIGSSLANIESAHTDILFPGGQILADEGVADVTPEFQTAMNNLVSGGDYTVLHYEGTQSLISVALVQSYDPIVNEMGWLVIVHQPSEVALAPLNAQLRTIILAGLLLAGLSILIAFFLSRSLTHPILGLTDVAQKIASGDLTIQAKVETSDEVGQLASTFNSMTAQLRDSIGTLEQRVTDRTKALATSTEVSRRLSTILNRKELVEEVVNQVKDSFGYYHTQIYFYDDEHNNLVMAGGTGGAGEKMLAQFHKIAKGRGLVGKAAETNQVVLVADTVQEPEWLPNVLLPDTKSEVAIPVAIGDQVLGVLDVQHNVVNGLKEDDVNSLQSIANQVAIALQNIRSTETVAKRAVELQTVAAISTAASTIRDIQEMLESVVRLTQRQFGLYHAHIFLYNAASADLEIAACGWKEGDEHEGTHESTAIPLAQEQSLVARAGRTREPVIVNNVQGEPGWLPNPVLPDTAAEMAVPMVVGGQLVGVLDVQSDRLNAFSAEDASIQTTLASQLATALENVRSFTRAQQEADREAMLNAISQKIQGTTSVEAALQMAARELGHALGMKPTLVALDRAALTDQKTQANQPGEPAGE